MTLRVVAMLAVTAALAACGGGRRSAITAEITGDAGRGTATMTCRASTSGMCHAAFLSGGAGNTLEVATGASATASGLAAGTRFCVGDTAPDPASCKAMDLADGRQIVRHEQRVRD